MVVAPIQAGILMGALGFTFGLIGGLGFLAAFGLYILCGMVGCLLTLGLVMLRELAQPETSPSLATVETQRSVSSI